MRIPREAHLITIFPVDVQGYPMHDWKCSCGNKSGHYFDDFSLATRDGLVHVGGQQVFVTRPHTEDGGTR